MEVNSLTLQLLKTLLRVALFLLMYNQPYIFCGCIPAHGALMCVCVCVFVTYKLWSQDARCLLCSLLVFYMLNLCAVY